MIYLDYAATAPLRPEVLEAMLPLLRENYGNPDSLHAFGRRAAQCVLDARDRIAGVLGVRAEEVYFTSGGTEADNWAVRGMGRGKAVVSALEHAAALSSAPLREGSYAICPAGEDGIVHVSDLGHTMSEDAGLVCVMAVNNETGSVQSVSELSAYAHAHGAHFFTDCVQAACTQDLSKIAACADGLSLSAHKIGGPKGVGALIVKRGVPLKPLIAGGEQERGLRGGTLNVAGIVGFARALELAQGEREAFLAHTGMLSERFTSILKEALGEGVRFDGERRAPNILHATFANGGSHLLNLLDLRGLAVSGGAACSAHAAQPSHVMLAMGRSEAEARRGVRFSFGSATTEEDVSRAAAVVISCI